MALQVKILPRVLAESRKRCSSSTGRNFKPCVYSRIPEALRLSPRSLSHTVQSYIYNPLMRYSPTRVSFFTYPDDPALAPPLRRVHSEIYSRHEEPWPKLLSDIYALIRLT